jgi:hypothetical protein
LAVSSLAVVLALGGPLFCQSTPKCRTETLSITQRDALVAGGGNLTINYVLTNRGSHACTLIGYPTVVPLDKNGKAVAEIRIAHLPGVWPGPPDQRVRLIQLKPGSHAWFQIQENDGMGLDDFSLCDKATQIRITPPNNSQPFDQLFSFGTCTGKAGISFVLPGIP